MLNKANNSIVFTDNWLPQMPILAYLVVKIANNNPGV